MFTAGMRTGAIGSGVRNAANAACTTAAAGFTFPRTNVVAFISVAASDEIRDLPANFTVPTDGPMVGPTGLVVANNWADLLDGSIARSLADAGVMAAIGLGWWTGSNVDGAVAMATCTTWSNGTNSVSGAYGILSATDTTWIHSGSATNGAPCNASLALLCLGYTP